MRAPSRLLTTRTAFFAIVAVAAVLRFWGIRSGIPYAIGVDEPQVLNRSLTMMGTGDFNPHFFDYGTLYIYVQLAVACLRFMCGALMGYWTSLSQASLPDFLVWGRAVTAALGTLTTVVVYYIGERWTPRHGLLAAGLMAVIPLHVRESHFVLTDVPLTFFCALTCLVTLRAADRASAAPFAIAGAVAGLATATKYPGVLALIMPLLAVWMTPHVRPGRLAAALTVLAAAGAAFLIAAPYTVIDLPGFLNGYARLMASYTGEPSGEPGWSLYLKHLRRSMEWPAFVALIAGSVVAIARASGGAGRLQWTLILAFPLLFFWFISRQSLVFGRYLLPILPFVSLLAAAGVITTAGLLPRFPLRRQVRTAVVVLLTMLVTLPPAVAAISFDTMQARRNTAALAFDWIRQNVPAGTKIAVEGTDLVLMYSPYDLVQMPQLRQRTFDQYRDAGVAYLVASSQAYGPYLADARGFRREYSDYMTLFSHAREVARFAPSDEHPGAELRILSVR